MNNFKVYITNHKQSIESKKSKSKEDYIVSKTNFVYRNNSISFANHDILLSEGHLVQLTTAMSKKKIKRLVSKRQAVKNALRDEIKRINVVD